MLREALARFDRKTYQACATASSMKQTGLDWTGRRVTLMGLGVHGGGLGAARFLVERGARVTISDAADHTTLAASLRQLRDVPIEAIRLNGHDEVDFRHAEVVVVNPAIPPDNHYLKLARRSGAVLTSEIEIFLRHCSGRVIGVTGSNGKSTTCAMISSILKTAGQSGWLGGNFGGSLLSSLPQISPKDWVVLELSSFQLAHLGSRAPLPTIAAITNCTPNHIDWHGDFETYRRAKQRLIAEQSPGATTVVHGDDPLFDTWARAAAGRVRTAWPLDRLDVLSVLGHHNRQNAALAAAVAEAAGVELLSIARGLQAFQGLRNRLERIADVRGRRVINDSKSTTPHATTMALAAVDGPLWLLAGGHSKGAPLDELAMAIVARAQGAALFGASRHALQSAITHCDPDFKTCTTEHLADALAWCWRQSQTGDVILLSPACASHDQYHDFVARGTSFCRLARALDRAR